MENPQTPKCHFFCCSRQKKFPGGCKNAVLPEPLTKNHLANCLNYQGNARKLYDGNLCLLEAIALILHANGAFHEKIWEISNLLEKTGANDPASLQGVYLNDISIIEDLAWVNVFLYNIDIVNAALIRELARKSVGNHSNTSTTTLEQSHLLCLQYQCSRQILSLLIVWSIY